MMFTIWQEQIDSGGNVGFVLHETVMLTDLSSVTGYIQYLQSQDVNNSVYMAQCDNNDGNSSFFSS